MRIVIVIIVILLSITGIFLYFLLIEDKNLIDALLKNFHKEKIIEPEKNLVDIKYFEEWLHNIDFADKDLEKVKTEIHKKVIWMEEFINAIILNILCWWNILVEWVPWLAKTKTISTFAQVIWMDFKRIQFTPDMLPSDITWIEIYNTKNKEFEVKLGPIVANIILADEINRSTPKVQSALLEAMQEKQITIWWQTYMLPDPFFVLATQNPIEQEWTYPLPEAQVDRFLFKIIVNYPHNHDEKKVLDSIEDDSKIHVKKVFWPKEFIKLKDKINKVVVSDEMKHYITRLIGKTREKNPNLIYGASPRWSIWLMNASRALAFIEWKEFVTHQEIQRVALSVLRHRIILSYNAKINWITEDEILLDLFREVSLI